MPKRYIVVLATAWGPRYGGINSFNYDLCRALPSTLADHRVVCLTLDGTATDESDAAGVGVKLISLERPHDDVFDRSLCQQVLAILESHEIHARDVEWWVGHDLKSGELALDLAAATRKSQSAVIMHMSYADYAYAKHVTADVSIKIERQRALFSRADMALAVGPLLHKRVKEFRSTTAPTMRLIPGLPEYSSDLPRGRLCAITFGRFEPTEALIKQAPLAVAGFASAIKVGREQHSSVFEDATFQIVGVPDEHRGALTALAEKHASRLLNIQMHSFIHDRTELRNRLTRSNLSMMLSWHEGFGLTGWEAIGTGVPTIISRESGVFRLLDEIGGHATGCLRVLDIRGSAGKSAFNKKDLDDLQRTILTIGNNLDKHLADANALSRQLRTQSCFTWESTAMSFAKALHLKTTIPRAVGVTNLDSTILTEHPELHKWFDDAAARDALKLAEALTKRGQYDNALHTLDAIETSRRPPSLEHLILKAEIQLRLNQYGAAESAANSALLAARDAGDMCAVISAMSVLNTIHRDRGNYDVAVSLGRELLQLALDKCPAQICSAKRKLSRALSLEGSWQAALTEATDALTLARSSGDAVAEAKCHLAIGEAHRHGLDQLSAIPEYVNARNLAGKLGHVDCYLWSALGLSDSLVLVGENQDADACLNKLTGFIQASQQNYPLETLHLSLCRLVIARIQGKDVDREVDEVLRRYRELSVKWPDAYVKEIRRGNYSLPKKF